MEKTVGEQTVGIALLGTGVVGRGVIDILAQQRDLLRSRTGLTIEVRSRVCRDPSKYEDDETGIKATTNIANAIGDPKTGIVVEVMGGIDAPRHAISAALAAGKHVVTANKALLAAHGAELFELAKKHGVSIAFEASCGGGIPIIDALTRGLVANRIDALIGIINGTCNFILTQMAQNGWTYADALKEAQRIGFAEADPTMDVSGRDSAQKLAILATLAFNQQVSETDIALTGIDTLKAEDLQFVDDLGYVIKLLGIGERVEGQLALRVQPTLVHKGDLMSDVSGGFNAISVYGHAIGHQFFYGRGAGQTPTASAVVADILGVAMGTIPHAFERLNVFHGRLKKARALPADQMESRFYLRATTQDTPGVLAGMTQALARHGISIAAVHQPEIAAGTKHVPIVVTTHKASEGAMQKALAEIDAMKSVQAPTVFLRILERPAEFG